MPCGRRAALRHAWLDNEILEVDTDEWVTYLWFDIPPGQSGATTFLYVPIFDISDRFNSSPKCGLQAIRPNIW